jgi:hypothetical protein
VQEAEPELESEAEPLPEPPFDAEPELAPDADAQTVPEPSYEAEGEVEPEPEEQPEPVTVLPAAEATVQSVTRPQPQATEDEREPDEEPTWDRERYSTDIEAPDWWTPEALVWAEPEVASDGPTVDEPSSVVARIDDLEPAATISESSDDPAPASTSPSTIRLDPDATSREPYRGEETVLWFGRRPDRAPSTEWPSEDAAAEMEVASTGRRATADPEPATAMPGSQELREALAGLDAPATQRPEVTERPPASPSPPVRPSAPARSGPASVPPQPGELRSPASRAYRRLRRIFPS